MSDEMMHTPETAALEDSAVHTVHETIQRFLDAASVDAVYGPPIQHGETLVIPAAEVLSGLGFGVGSGSGSGADDEGKPSEGKGGGGGGGGRVLSRPVAVVIVEPGGVRVEPVVDVTKIALAALTAAGFVFGMLARMRAGQIDEE